jgi:3-hydroxy-9,10-secoandrosta-1,3,5(10)-triene-9,17-dione monooxygenase
VLIPKGAFTIDHGSWNVIGMRGTGSKDIVLPETFVPDTHRADWNAMQAGHGDNGKPGLPLNVLFAMSVLAPTLGAASLIASEVQALVSRRVSAGTKERQIHQQKSQIDVATGIATMHLLRTNLLADSDRLVETVRNGRAVDLETRALLRMKIALSSRLALATAQQLLADIGGSLLPQGTRIERTFRDIHAMSSHFLLQPDPIGEAFGRLSLGLDLPPSARL